MENQEINLMKGSNLVGSIGARAILLHTSPTHTRNHQNQKRYSRGRQTFLVSKVLSGQHTFWSIQAGMSGEVLG